MQTLLAAVRRSCTPAVWSRGVQLSRAGQVLGHLRRDGEIEVRVGGAGRAQAYTVSLFETEQDWSCDCDPPSEEDCDACSHVAAAVIALAQAHKNPSPAEGAAPAALTALPKLVYALGRNPEGLTLSRFVEADGQRQFLDQSVAVYTNSPAALPRFAATATDQRIDGALGGHRRGLLSKVTLQRLLALLIDSPDVLLDDRPVTIGGPRCVLRARLHRLHGQFVLSVAQDPHIQEVFANGAVRLGDTLQPIETPQLSPQRLQSLRRGEAIDAADLWRLENEILPELRRQMPVECAKGLLPEVQEMAQSLRFEVEPSMSAEAGGFSLLATLVYHPPGRPQAPCAKVELGQLRYLGGAMPRRDRAAEARLQAEARRLGLELGQRRHYTGPAAIAMADCLAQRTPRPEGFAAAQCFASAAALVPHLSLRDGSFTVEFTAPQNAAAPGSPTAPPPSGCSAAAVLHAWQTGDPLVRLLDGVWAPLPQQWLAAHGHRVVELLAARDADGRLPRPLQVCAVALLDDTHHDVPADLRRLHDKLAALTQLPQAALSPHLKGLLRDYQVQGVNWLCFLRDAQLGALLADDMGLGKTLQALCCLRRGEPALVVAPTSVLFNWSAELQKFRPDLKVMLYHGTARSLQQDADVVLTSYAVMRLDREILQQHAWKIIILDEAQSIKNSDSQVARAAYTLQAPFRLALTGTPIENNLTELWSQFHFINPGLLGDRGAFEERFGRPIADGVAGAAAALQTRLRPFLLRRRKSEVAPQLPARSELVLRCTLSATERQTYDAVRAATVPQVLQQLQGGGNVMQALEALLRLRQACCHPRLLPGYVAEGEGTSAKLVALLEALTEAVAEGHKALVFSQWTKYLDLVEPHLHSASLSFVRLDGSTPNRQQVVQKFQSASGPPVMLISLKAGGTGLNLTAADHVFLLDPWWNPAVEDQAADRAHRIGQTRPVFIHKLIAEDTVEEKILQLQARKKEMATAALSGLTVATSLSRDDIAQLLA
jgi:superfamily II DNA or RNA helicase